MLLRIISSPQSQCNEKRYILKDVSANLLFLSIAQGPSIKIRLCLPKMPCEPCQKDFPVRGFTLLYFPV